MQAEPNGSWSLRCAARTTPHTRRGSREPPDRDVRCRRCSADEGRHVTICITWMILAAYSMRGCDAADKKYWRASARPGPAGFSSRAARQSSASRAPRAKHTTVYQLRPSSFHHSTGLHKWRAPKQGQSRNPSGSFRAGRRDGAVGGSCPPHGSWGGGGKTHHRVLHSTRGGAQLVRGGLIRPSRKQKPSVL